MSEFNVRAVGLPAIQVLINHFVLDESRMSELARVKYLDVSQFNVGTVSGK